MMGLAGALLLAIAVAPLAAGAEGAAFGPLPAADRACESDADCSVVMTRCCACELAVVSRAHGADVTGRVRAALDCPDEACPIACAAPEVVCSEGLCEQAEGVER